MDSLFERFCRKVRITETCWLWEACRFENGYGYFDNRKAHRVSYELFKGTIPSGLEIDHLCRVRHCVNPVHLEAVPHHTNMVRIKSGSPCLHGNGIKRTCKPCLAEKARRYRAQQKVSV